MIFKCLGICGKEFDAPYCSMNMYGIYDPRCPYCGGIEFERVGDEE